MEYRNVYDNNTGVQTLMNQNDMTGGVKPNGLNGTVVNTAQQNSDNYSSQQKQGYYNQYYPAQGVQQSPQSIVQNVNKPANYPQQQIVQSQQQQQMQYGYNPQQYGTYNQYNSTAAATTPTTTLTTSMTSTTPSVSWPQRTDYAAYQQPQQQQPQQYYNGNYQQMQYNPNVQKPVQQVPPGQMYAAPTSTAQQTNQYSAPYHTENKIVQQSPTTPSAQSYNQNSNQIVTQPQPSVLGPQIANQYHNVPMNTNINIPQQQQQQQQTPNMQNHIQMGNVPPPHVNNTAVPHNFPPTHIQPQQPQMMYGTSQPYVQQQQQQMQQGKVMPGTQQQPMTPQGQQQPYPGHYYANQQYSQNQPMHTQVQTPSKAPLPNAQYPPYGQQPQPTTIPQQQTMSPNRLNPQQQQPQPGQYYPSNYLQPINNAQAYPSMQGGTPMTPQQQHFNPNAYPIAPDATSSSSPETTKAKGKGAKKTQKSKAAKNPTPEELPQMMQEQAMSTPPQPLPNVYSLQGQQQQPPPQMYNSVNGKPMTSPLANQQPMYQSPQQQHMTVQQQQQQMPKPILPHPGTPTPYNGYPQQFPTQHPQQQYQYDMSKPLPQQQLAQQLPMQQQQQQQQQQQHHQKPAFVPTNINFQDNSLMSNPQVAIPQDPAQHVIKDIQPSIVHAHNYPVNGSVSTDNGTTSVSEAQASVKDQNDEAKLAQDISMTDEANDVINSSFNPNDTLNDESDELNNSQLSKKTKKQRKKAKKDDNSDSSVKMDDGSGGGVSKKKGRKPKIRDMNTSIDDTITATIMSITGTEQQQQQQPNGGDLNSTTQEAGDDDMATNDEVKGKRKAGKKKKQRAAIAIDESVNDSANMSNTENIDTAASGRKKRQYKNKKRGAKAAGGDVDSQNEEQSMIETTTSKTYVAIQPREGAVEKTIEDFDGDKSQTSLAADEPAPLQYIPRQRRKNSQHLAKLLKKKQRKKKKKNSSDEEEEEDDSDEYELPPAINAALMKSQSSTGLAVQDSAFVENSNGSVPIIPDDGRRSSRAAASKNKKYMNDVDLNKLILDNRVESGDDGAAAANVDANPAFALATNDTFIVEKILGHRMSTRKLMPIIAPDATKHETEDMDTVIGDVLEALLKCLEDDKPYETAPSAPVSVKEEVAEESEEEDAGEEVQVEEFYVKYKSLSYLHTEWRTRDELLVTDKRIDQKIKRYHLKKSQEVNYGLTGEDGEPFEEEYFNPDYLEVDRVLDSYEILDHNGETLTYYLVKWRVLAYEEATWELKADVNKTKIEQYERFNQVPSDTKYALRPRLEKWKRQTETRVYKNGNSLREYQLEGINWLSFCWINGRNCILADEMGLGKTVQSVTFLQEIADYGIRGPFLVIVPLSTIGNWNREFDLWTDFNVIVYHGSSASRQLIQDYEFYYKERDTNKALKNFTKFNALITTFEVLMSDVTLFCQFKWRSVIIDEAHRLKNKNCKLIEGLRYLDVEHKVLLTGTPLQNNVEELFSLLNFLEPQQFHSSQEFLQEFGDLKTDTQVTKLQAILKPMMLRRLKEDVEKNLAPKEETIIEVELTNTQKKYYRAILEKNFQFLSRGAVGSNMPNLMNIMMELRKCCNHPYLINGAEDQILAEYHEQHGTTSSNDEAVLKAMVQASGKLVLVDKLLPKLKAGGHKVLIFSQMIRVLDIIEDYLINMKWLYERIDGRIRGELRQEAIDRFSKPDSDRFAFLLCTRAGGLGINLTAADTVIIYDSDWNPQNDLQAQARCHRIGQVKSVKIYRLVTRNTYEREMFDRASLKLGLDKAVLQTMRNDERLMSNNSQLSKKEIEDLLKKGAYGTIMEDDNAGDKFCEEDIDKILQQRATVIQIEGGEKGSTFSKASFSTSETVDISVDDPEFWQKWAKKAEIDIETTVAKDDRIIYEPRRRTQTRRYGGPDDVAEEAQSEGYTSSDSEEIDPKTGKAKKKSKRKGDDANGASGQVSENAWSKDDCYKVEKNLLVFGWNQWTRIFANCKFANKKRQISEQDVQSIARTILLYCLQHYHGDEMIKQFITDLIDPDKSKQDNFKNHFGLAAPVPRGRKGRKTETSEDIAAATTAATTTTDTHIDVNRNADELLADENYKKHLVRQANRILLRVRMLFYIRQEIIGECAGQIDEGLGVNDIDLQMPEIQADLPADWWDNQADKSLIVGVYKYGYEKYNKMRSDPCLSFLSLCGPPDAKDLLAEQQQEADDAELDEPDDSEYKPTNEKRLFKDLDEMGDDNTQSTESKDEQKSVTQSRRRTAAKGVNEKHQFPTISELNVRLRRIITTYQKLHKKEILMSKRNAERQEKRLSKLASTQERAVQRQMEKQTKWSRREETNFYRAISTFGVDFDKTTNVYAWDRFREIGQLDKKLDETLTDYYQAFVYMCKRVCHKTDDTGSTADEPLPPNDVTVEPITEERASRCLQRIDLLNKIRQDIWKRDDFEERIKLCKPSADLPDWWQPGKHDRDLIAAVARYGLTRTEHYFLNDKDFTFKDDLTQYMKFIETLMGDDDKTDPIQYYFLNQARIQSSYKEHLRSLDIAAGVIAVKGDGEEEMKVEEKEGEEEAVVEPSKAVEEASVVAMDEEVKAAVEEEAEAKTVIDETIVDKSTANGDVSMVSEQGELKIVEDESINNKAADDVETEDKVEESPAVVAVAVKVEVKENGDEIEMKTETIEAKPEPEPQPEVAVEVKVELTNEVVVKEDERTASDVNVEVKQPQQQQQPDANDFNITDTRQMGVPTIMWPKDRVLLNRIDNIISCIENNEWPDKNPFMYCLQSQQQDQHGNSSSTMDMNQMMMMMHDRPSSPVLSTSDINDTDQNSNDKDYRAVEASIRATAAQQQQQQKQRRGRPSKFDDPTSKIRSLLEQLPPGILGPDIDMQNLPLAEIMNAAKSSLLEQAAAAAMGGTSASSSATTPSMPSVSSSSSFLEPGEIIRKTAKENLLSSSTRSDSPNPTNSNKRSRTSSTKDRVLQQQKSSMSMFLTPGLDPNERIPVVNMEDGTRLQGKEAPKRQDLADFLVKNPVYLPDQPDIYDFAFGNRRSAKVMKPNQATATPHDAMELFSSPLLNSKAQQSSSKSNKTPDVQKSTSSKPDVPLVADPIICNVGFINKVSNKKFVPNKPPTWKNLCSFLDKNVDIYIESQYADMLRSKYGPNLPNTIKARLLPSKPSVSNTKLVNSNSSTPKQAASSSKTPSASLMSTSSKNASTPVAPSSSSSKKPVNKNTTPLAQPQITYPPLSPQQQNGLMPGLNELLMSQAAGGFNPLAGLAGFSGAGASAANSLGLPFGGLGGFNPFLMPPYSSFPQFEDFLKQISQTKPDDSSLKIDDYNSIKSSETDDETHGQKEAMMKQEKTPKVKDNPQKMKRPKEQTPQQTKKEKQVKNEQSFMQQQQSLMDQEKLMQDLISAQFSSMPYFNALGGGFPQLPGGAGANGNGLDSTSPKSSTNSTASASAMGMPGSLDFNMFLSNLMNPLGGGAGSGGSAASMTETTNDVTQQPGMSTEFLAALSAIGSNMFDPNMMNSAKNPFLDALLQQQAQQNELPKMTEPKASKSKQQSQHKPSDNHKRHHSSSTPITNNQSKQMKPRQPQQAQQQQTQKQSSDESFQGLDLSIKKSK